MKIGLGRRELRVGFIFFFWIVIRLLNFFIPLKPKSIFHQLFVWLKSIRVVTNSMIFTCLVTNVLLHFLMDGERYEEKTMIQ